MSGKAHLLLVVLSLGAIVFILRLVRREALKAKYALLWLTIGLGLLVMAAVPSLLDTVSGWLGVDYEPTVWIIAGLAFLFVLSVHFSWELSRLEDRARTLAEEVALLRKQIDDSVSSSSPSNQ